MNVVEETVVERPPAIRVAGWALDYDTNASIDVHVYVDGQWAARATANASRPDVAAAYPGMGPAHGFDVSVPAGPGPHTVCVYGINAGPSGNGEPAARVPLGEGRQPLRRTSTGW